MYDFIRVDKSNKQKFFFANVMVSFFIMTGILVILDGGWIKFLFGIWLGFGHVMFYRSIRFCRSCGGIYVKST